MGGGEEVAAEIYVSGRVQGVGYRFFTERIAAEYSIKGWSKNLPDGRVQLVIEGEKEKAELFVKELEKGPRGARVSRVEVAWEEPRKRFSGFSIRF